MDDGETGRFCLFVLFSNESHQMAPDYDHLSLMQKVEVFEHALEHTQGDDLSKILWLRSPSSEVSSCCLPFPFRNPIELPSFFCFY